MAVLYLHLEKLFMTDMISIFTGINIDSKHHIITRHGTVNGICIDYIFFLRKCQVYGYLHTNRRVPCIAVPGMVCHRSSIP